jgi:hypothetical protein
LLLVARLRTSFGKEQRSVGRRNETVGRSVARLTVWLLRPDSEQCQVGSLAGAAHLLKDNAGAL